MHFFVTLQGYIKLQKICERLLGERRSNLKIGVKKPIKNVARTEVNSFAKANTIQKQNTFL